jgi:ribosomal protein S18 acetylase RimI-like enzyme
MSAEGQALQATIETARWPAEVPLARALFLEYAAWLDIDLCFQGFDAELAGLPGGYAPPGGGLWFARVGGQDAGVVGLRPFGAEGRVRKVCEMKRLWIRPDYRGLGLGRRLAEQTLAAGQLAGYRRMRLDTLHSMVEARALYTELGFRDVTAGVAEPHPELIYMELDLAGVGAQG